MGAVALHLHSVSCDAPPHDATDVFYMGGVIEELWYSVGQIEDLICDVESDNWDQGDVLDDHEWRFTAREAGVC